MALWKQVLICKYGPQGGRWLPSLDYEGKISRVWGDILIQFWFDKWYINTQLKEEFPRLFSISNDKEGSLQDFVQRRDRSGDWKLSYRRPLLAREEEEVGRLHCLLNNAPELRPNYSDSLKWTASDSSQFTVASLKEWAEGMDGPKLQISRMLWHNFAPPKIQFFGWLAWNGRVKTAAFFTKNLGNKQ
ncbi:hypothetical protein ACSBR2_016185 [Camellia fascicularis]